MKVIGALNLEGAKVYRASYEALPPEIAKFDVIVARAVGNHKSLAEMGRFEDEQSAGQAGPLDRSRGRGPSERSSGMEMVSSALASRIEESRFTLGSPCKIRT